ncbi:transitional endoplasmic reticulum ATPase [Catenuloplanes nepalensis]|uniref:Transitional endoplasmic reticulum ATPase n=1 Tax=Catenuloplanes nepalensis TaxID=587533 RepID=A0ABT9N3R4_9ACTN|nr:AAA family ATPase [Catenuloplanes nepalensis]MDP9798153.1 transitional endoplasmic reticulum ATPase [Catenuloplanes nepalensis]
MSDAELTLTAMLRPAALDARRGIVRLHPEVLAALGLHAGDPVRLSGQRTTAGIVALAEPTSSRAILYADDLILGNLGLREGGQITIASIPTTGARRVVLSGSPEIVVAVSADMLRLALLGKVVTAGDDVSLLPQDVLPDATTLGLVQTARRSLANTVGFGWTTTLLRVESVEDSDGALVTMDTVVTWAGGGHTTHGQTFNAQPAAVRRAPAPGPARSGAPGPGVRGSGAPGFSAPGFGAPGSGTSGSGASGGTAFVSAASAAASAASSASSAEPIEAEIVEDDEVVPPVEDLPGLRAQAHELSELLDLGFHHREVLGRLGATVSLGVLITGPAGSGKGVLVRSVAASVGARVTALWAPELVALSNEAAARRLRAAADTISGGDKPGVLLVADVDALVPRADAGPLATVFRQVIAALIKAGTAVVCTSSRPEELDPALRAPDLLSVQISVSLPDAVLRREQLDVLTRGMPLAEDVRLDDVAGRTPGFVAADLSALTREAAVRAALRQKAEAPETPTITMADFSAALEVVRPTSMAESTLELARVTLDDVGDMAEVKQLLTESVLWPLTYPDTFARLGVQAPRGVLLYGPPGCGKTYLVKAVAGSGKANVLSVKGAELLSKWVGESERAVRELFRRAREAAPTLVFLDEVDALAPVRGQASDGGTTDRVVAALLTELDGVESLRNVVVIGATNRPDLIDPALLRPGRLERVVYVPPPDAEARTAILRAAAKPVPLADDVDLAALGTDLENFSAADCAALIREAALAAMRESLDATSVTATHVATARTRVRPSLDPAQVAHLAAYADSRSR